MILNWSKSEPCIPAHQHFDLLTSPTRAYHRGLADIIGSLSERTNNVSQSTIERVLFEHTAETVLSSPALPFILSSSIGAVGRALQMVCCLERMCFSTAEVTASVNWAGQRRQ